MKKGNVLIEILIAMILLLLLSTLTLSIMPQDRSTNSIYDEVSEDCDYICALEKDTP